MDHYVSREVWVDLATAIKNLSYNHSMCMVSFVYGFMIARNVPDEMATSVANAFGSKA